MLPALQFLITLASGIVIFVFVGYYILSLRAKEKRLQKQESAVDTDYHKVVNKALTEERKILDDASSQASDIITQSKYLSEESQKEINDAIKAVVSQIKKEGENITREFTGEYTSSLKNLSNESLTEFQKIMSELQTDLNKQNKDFQNTLLPEIQKEVEAYKKIRMQQVDQAVTGIVQKASQEIFNKTISIADHQAVIIQSLEKAKKEGIFD
jgi:hypothetical protein